MPSAGVIPSAESLCRSAANRPDPMDNPERYEAQGQRTKYTEITVRVKGLKIQQLNPDAREIPEFPFGGDTVRGKTIAVQLLRKVGDFRGF